MIKAGDINRFVLTGRIARLVPAMDQSRRVNEGARALLLNIASRHGHDVESVFVQNYRLKHFERPSTTPLTVGQYYHVEGALRAMDHVDPQTKSLIDKIKLRQVWTDKFVSADELENEVRLAPHKFTPVSIKESSTYSDTGHVYLTGTVQSVKVFDIQQRPGWTRAEFFIGCLRPDGKSDTIRIQWAVHADRKSLTNTLVPESRVLVQGHLRQNLHRFSEIQDVPDKVRRLFVRAESVQLLL
jgi:hypothetical protein